jgi:ornithine carbamoyltransferase
MTTMRHLIEIDDLLGEEILRILELSEVRGLPRVLEGRGAMLLFEKPSARTRTSMEMAVVQLGGHPVTLRNEEVGIDTRERAEDLGSLLSRYGSVIGARVFEHHKVERLAAASSVPVVNLLSDDAHPVQALADLLTLRQEFGDLSGLGVAYVGDANNVARSLGLACGLVGARFVVSSPPGYGFDPGSLERLGRAGGIVEVVDDPHVAVRGVHAVYTDAWYSMGQEDERLERAAVFERWRVDDALMAAAGERAIFLHCLPAHRGDEATDEVLDGPRSRIWAQAENRMHTARGLLAWLLDEGLR